MKTMYDAKTWELFPDNAFSLIPEILETFPYYMERTASTAQIIAARKFNATVNLTSERCPRDAYNHWRFKRVET